jgi:hypothetical protein
VSLRIIGLKLQRKLITVPVAEDVVGCLVPTPEQCAAVSGSGPQPCDPCEAPACVTTCRQCPGGMSGVWLFPFGDGVVRLCHVESPNDGNDCRFLSVDLAWELSYVESAGVALWQLVNYDRNLFYFLDADLWDCTGDNTLEDLDGNPLTVSPLSICQSWNCEDGSCVEVAGAGGAYSTLAACETCCGQTSIEFTTPGTHEWTSCVTGMVTAKNIGGGGNGGTGSAFSSGSGGGGGEYAEGTFAAVAGMVYTIVVGGAGGDSAANGTSVVAKGGLHATGSFNGTGGTGGTGAVTFDGGYGGTQLLIVGTRGAGGGSSASGAGAGTNVGSDDPAGGVAPAGGGNGGNGGTNVVGQPGYAPGGGGGGGGGNGTLGGSGAAGKVRLEW